MIHLGVWAREPWLRLKALRYLALPLIMRRAFSSESGFLGFLDLGFGLLKFPSLRDHGSRETAQEMVVALGFDLGVLFWDFGNGELKGVVQINEDFRDSMSGNGQLWCLRRGINPIQVTENGSHWKEGR